VGAASKLVDRLERDSLAVRAAHPTDRRSSLVALTRAGDTAHDDGVALVDAALTEHFEGIDLGEMTSTLTVLLGRLRSPLAAVSA